MRQINKIIIHGSATPPSMDVGLEEVRQWHTLPWLNPNTDKLRYMGRYYDSDEDLPSHVRGKRGRGFTGPGYHHIIRRPGVTEDARPISKVGAHAVGHNKDSIGICMIGGVTEADIAIPENNFTAHQFTELEVVVRRYVNEFPGVFVGGHRDLPGANTECPSFDAVSWWNGLHS